MPPPPNQLPQPTQFELELHEAISAAWGSGSGTVWGPAADVVQHELGWPPHSVGLIGVTSDGVKNNRPLSAGLITNPRRLVLIPVAEEVGLDAEQDAVVELIPKTRHLTTVGLVSLVDSGQSDNGPVWRVQRLIEVEGLGVADEVAPHFPLISNVVRCPLVPFGNGSDSLAEPWALVGPKGARILRFVRRPTGGSPATLQVGDRVLLCDAQRLFAHGAGVVSRITHSAELMSVELEPSVPFEVPIEMAVST